MRRISAIVDLVREGEDANGHLFRPLVDDTAELSTSAEQQVVRALELVMKECWAEKDITRPSFDVCFDLLYRLTADK